MSCTKPKDLKPIKSWLFVEAVYNYYFIFKDAINLGMNSILTMMTDIFINFIIQQFRIPNQTEMNRQSQKMMIKIHGGSMRIKNL